MSDYSQEEIRLLDEFAKAALSTYRTDPQIGRSWHPWDLYDDAAAMIAERRKRVPKPQPESRVTDPAQDLIDQWDAQPEPEKGELTEEAVAYWREHARCNPDGAGFYMRAVEIDRAVALMREGLAAKESLEQCKQHHSATFQDWKRAEKERDEAREEADRLSGELAETNIGWERQLSKALCRAEKAESELAAVQPVLDAVVSHFKFPYAKWEIDPFKTLQAYADRRRAQAKGAS